MKPAIANIHDLKTSISINESTTSFYKFVTLMMQEVKTIILWLLKVIYTELLTYSQSTKVFQRSLP